MRSLLLLFLLGNALFFFVEAQDQVLQVKASALVENFTGKTDCSGDPTSTAIALDAGDVCVSNQKIEIDTTAKTGKLYDGCSGTSLDFKDGECELQGEADSVRVTIHTNAISSSPSFSIEGFTDNVCQVSQGGGIAGRRCTTYESQYRGFVADYQNEWLVQQVCNDDACAECATTATVHKFGECFSVFGTYGIATGAASVLAPASLLSLLSASLLLALSGKGFF